MAMRCGFNLGGFRVVLEHDTVHTAGRTIHHSQSGGGLGLVPMYYRIRPENLVSQYDARTNLFGEIRNQFSEIDQYSIVPYLAVLYNFLQYCTLYWTSQYSTILQHTLHYLTVSTFPQLPLLFFHSPTFTLHLPCFTFHFTLPDLP